MLTARQEALMLLLNRPHAGTDMDNSDGEHEKPHTNCQRTDAAPTEQRADPAAGAAPLAVMLTLRQRWLVSERKSRNSSDSQSSSNWDCSSCMNSCSSYVYSWSTSYSSSNSSLLLMLSICGCCQDRV